MNLVIFSDTHGTYPEIPNADVAVFAGDCSSRGSEEVCKQFIRWFGQQEPMHKIMIGGNHDFWFQTTPYGYIKDYAAVHGVIYLENTGTIIENTHFWGSPLSLEYGNWANTYPKEKGKEYWDMIPRHANVIITHGPPYGVMDECAHPRKGENPHVGCKDLLSKVLEVKPKLHIFGHIHESYGKRTLDGIDFINASHMNLRYEPVNPIIKYDYD